MNRSAPFLLCAVVLLVAAFAAPAPGQQASADKAGAPEKAQTPEKAEAPDKADAPGESAQAPAPLLVWAFDGESERASSALPDSEAAILVTRHGFMEGPPRGPRYMAFDRAGQPRCAVALSQGATVLNASQGRAVVCDSTTIDFIDDHCQVHFSHPAEGAACLLNGEVLAVDDGGHLLFLDGSGSTKASSSLRDTSILIAASDGGNLLAVSNSLRVFDPWGRQIARIELESSRVARKIAGGPDRVYVVTANEEKQSADETVGQEELLAAYELDGTQSWTEKLEPTELDVIGLWAWPDGRGVVIGLTDKEIPGAGLNTYRLEARDSGGTRRWQLPMTESGAPTRLDVAFAKGSGDIAVTISDQLGATPRAAILVVSPDGKTRALLRVTAVVREGGAQLSDGGHYLSVNAVDQGLLRVYKVP